MRSKSGPQSSAEEHVREIRRATRKQYGDQPVNRRRTLPFRRASIFDVDSPPIGVKIARRFTVLSGTEEIARHTRSYERGAFVFDPLHYLALLEQKPGALDRAAPLQGWDLPEQFDHLRRLMEQRSGNKGKREFIQVLRLMEVFEQDLIAAAITHTIRLGAISFDAVKQIALARIERRPPRLDLDAYPHLPRANVQTTRAASYAALTEGLAA